MPSTTTAKKMWRKRFLVPLWVVELIVMGIFFILACVVLSYANDPDVEDAGYGGVFAASGAIIISITGVTIILTLIEIGLFAATKLKPTLHLVSAVIKALIWLIYFIIIIAGSAASGSGSALDIVLSLAVVVCTIAQVIYGSIIVHRVRKGVYNNYGFNDNTIGGFGGNDGHGPATYESAENGIKMESQPTPAYR